MTKRHTNGQAAFVVCVNNAEYPASLELHKIYRVLPDAQAAADGDLRVVDESGDDYLYPADYFLPLKLPPPVAKALLGARRPADSTRR